MASMSWRSRAKCQLVEAQANRGSSGWSLLTLGREGAGGADGAPDDDVGEALVQVGQLGLARLRLDAEHQEVAHPAARVVVAVEAQDLLAASSIVLVTLNRARSSGETQPAAMASSCTKRSHACQ